MNEGATVGELEKSLARAITWVQRHDYKAYEPADGNSSLLFPLTMGRVWPMRVLQQLVLRSPINLRPVLGVRRHTSAIGRGYMAWCYLTMLRRDRDVAVRDEAIACLTWLIQNRAPAVADFCWGDPYDYATRSGRRPMGAPILIWTALVGQVFLDAFELLKDEQYVRVAESVGRWISALPREQTPTGCCLSYNAYKLESIHNSNAMGAAFLARLAARTGDQAAAWLAHEAMQYTCARQREDGSWWYGEETKYHWVDNFHTGYNISALKVYQDAVHDQTFESQLKNGFVYFKRHFFEADGRPRYFNNALFPIDIQCAAQAIETLVAMADHDPDALTIANRVASWTIERLQAPDGHFCYRDLGSFVVTTPMLHWGQGTMSKALAALINRVSGGSAVAGADRFEGAIA
jgi:hypothetical protein